MRRNILAVCTGCLLLIALIAQVSAVSVTISPEQIEEGDTITIGISGLENGSVFALRMEAAIELNNASTFAYQSNKVTVPFEMDNPRVILLASPVTEAGLEASEGDTIKRMTQRTQTGEVRVTQTLDTIPSGTIDILKAFGTPVSGSEYVDMSLELSGTKEGPDSGSITFGLEGISDGAARIIVLVDGNEAMNQEITIGTPTVIPTQTTAPTSSGGSGGATTPEPADLVSVSSLDGIVSLNTVASSVTGTSPEDIRIIQSEPVNIPSDWIAPYGSYIISPSGSSFQPGARLSFRMEEDAGVPFIATYRNGGWTIIPSRIEGSYMIAEIDEGGQYALFTYPATDQTQSETPESTQADATPSGTVVPVDSTEIPQTQIPQTQESAGGLMALIGAGIVGSIIIARTRRP